MNGARPRGSSWSAFAAALWSAVFAVFHIIWASGWYPLLNEEAARAAFAIPWKWWYDVVAASLCVIAVPTALAPVMSWSRRVPRRLVYTLAVTGTALLVFRAAASIAQTVYVVATDASRLADMSIWEPWFYLGAYLFTLSTWRSRLSVAANASAAAA